MSVVVNNFNVFDTALHPLKTKPPLVIDANTVLAFSIILQSFKSVLWRDSQVVQIAGPIQHRKLTQRSSFNIDPPLHPYAFKQLLRIAALEASNHEGMVTSDISNVKRYLNS